MGDRPLYTQSIDDVLSECFPTTGLIRTYLNWAYKTTHAPPIYHLASILPALACEMSRRGYFCLTNDVKQKIHLWTAIVGTSAQGKTTAIKTAKDFIDDWRNAHFGTKTLSPFLSAEGSIPGVMHVLAQDDYYQYDTEQTLCILYLQEFSRILWQNKEATALCQLYDGETYGRNLRGLQKEGQRGTIRNPTISAVFAGTQRSLEEYVSGEHIEGGLFSRILWFSETVSSDKLMPTAKRFESERVAALEYWGSWDKQLRYHEATSTKRAVEIDENNTDLIESLLFEPFREILASNDRLNSIRLRLLTHVKVVASVYAFSRGDIRVTDDDMMRAINLALYCEKATCKITATLATHEQISFRAKVLGVIESCGSFGATTSQIYKAIPSKVRSKKSLDEALDTLVDAGQVQCQRNINSSRGRHTYRYICSEFATELEEAIGMN